MQNERETNQDLRFISLDRAIFDGMASELLEKKGKGEEIPKITKITSLEEALSQLRKCGITDKDMAEYLDKRQRAMQEAFEKSKS